MERVIIYPGQIPLETDLLQTNKNAMIALSKLAAALLGVSTMVNGLTVVPTGPASLSVSVGPGEIYSLQNIDGTAYSSIAADTAHQIVKQGISLDSRLLACPAPATAGQSVNYLVQASFAETDTGAVVLPYYNASNPATAYSGPNNSGAAQSTLRQGLVSISAKAGVAAATGSQATPAPDAGSVGLYVVTVANGQTTINSGNISVYAGAPIIAETLTQKISQATADARYAALAGLSSQTFAVGAATLSQHAVNLGQFVATHGGSGYYKLPGGMILQRGTTSALSSGGASTITFPIAFPNACEAVFLSQVSGAALGANSNAATGTKTTNSCPVYSFSQGGGLATYDYFALGY